MTSGSYTYANEGGEQYGNNYSGSYQLRVINPLLSTQGSTADTRVIAQDFAGQELTFSDPFSLGVADYNGDGDTDFAIGQWSGSNGMIYCLYSVDDKGKIRLLDTDGPIYHAAPGQFSPVFEQLGENRFEVQQYDQEREKWCG
jgi:hypothetical protein